MNKAKKEEFNILDFFKKLELEKNIPQSLIIKTIVNVIISLYKNTFKEDNVEVEINKKTFEINLYSVKTVVEKVFNNVLEITIKDARTIDDSSNIGDKIRVKIDIKNFGRISITNAKNQIFHKLYEEEKNAIFNKFVNKKGTCVSGKVLRIIDNNIIINLGEIDAILTKSEQVSTEHFNIGDRIKAYVIDVIMSSKGPKILVSRTHKEFVRCLFNNETIEIQNGIVEIKAISREPGSRSKIAVLSNNEDVDPIGSCVGINSERVNAVVNELFGEKIDIINYDENPAYFIENALSPAKIIFVLADIDYKKASVIVPDYQLSLAIGKEGQNVRLAAHLTGYKIDIKSESKARESGELPENYNSAYEKTYYMNENS